LEGRKNRRGGAQTGEEVCGRGERKKIMAKWEEPRRRSGKEQSAGEGGSRAKGRTVKRESKLRTRGKKVVRTEKGRVQ